MKLLLIGFTALFSQSLLAMSPLEVMQNNDNLEDGNSSKGLTTMTLIDRKDRERVRELQMYSKDFGEDVKSVSFFLTPADVKGTGYLNFDWQDEATDDDSWLYLPALQKVKRIAAGDKSGSFMGSDFSYADINGTNIDWYNYEFINELAEVNGKPAWHIQSTPKPELSKQVYKETGVKQSEIWILKENFVQVKAKITMTKGGKTKYFQASELEQIDGIWTAKRMQMVTTKAGKKVHASVLQVKQIAYNVDVADNLFTTSAMQRGI